MGKVLNVTDDENLKEPLDQVQPSAIEGMSMTRRPGCIISGVGTMCLGLVVLQLLIN